jgi:hypothetical protein
MHFGSELSAYSLHSRLLKNHGGCADRILGKVTLLLVV